MRKLCLFIQLIILLSTIFGSKFEKESWNIFFDNFETSSVSANNLFLTRAIPEYLRDNIYTELGHHLTTEENYATFDTWIKKQIDLEEKNRLKAINDRDNLFFNGAKKEDLNIADKKIIEIENKISDLRLKKMDPSEIPINLPIKIIDNFTLKDKNNILNEIKAKDIDYYFYGRIEEDQGIIFLSLYYKSRYANNEELLFKGFGDTEEILVLRDELVKMIDLILANKNIVPLKITSEPRDTLIYINDSFKGIGVYEGYALNKESINIKIQKNGFSTIESRKIVAENNRDFSYNLVKNNEKLITITSEPDNALVLYGSRYLGKTPLEVPLNDYPVRLTLTLEGYVKKNLLLDPEKDAIHIKLDKVKYDITEVLEKNKKNFYLSLGVFSITLAVPLFLSGQQELISSNNGDLQMYTNIAIGNTIFWGIHLMYRLYLYWASAKESVE